MIAKFVTAQINTLDLFERTVDRDLEKKCKYLLHLALMMIRKLYLICGTFYEFFFFNQGVM